MAFSLDSGADASAYVELLVPELAQARSDQSDKWLDEGRDWSIADEKGFAHTWLNQAMRRVQEQRLSEGAAKLDDAAVKSIVQGVIDASFSGGRLLRAWNENLTATNLTAQGTEPVRLEQANGAILMLEPVANTVEQFRAAILACRAQSTRPDAPWDHQNHELELVLNDGTRLTAIDFVVPVPFVTLRRPTFKIVTLDDLVANETMTAQAGAFLKAAVKSKQRILVGGSMNSGKTVTLRALAAALPSDASLVTAESSGELLLKDGAGDPYPHFITPLEARRPGADGRGEVTLGQLIMNAQRMSPTCVIVGEVRGPEAQALAKSLRQGYQVMSTIHGMSAVDSVANAALYLEEYEGTPSDAALKGIVRSVDVVVFMEQIDGKRVVAEIAAPMTTFEDAIQCATIYKNGVMHPLPDVLKHKLARFGFGDRF